MDFQEVVARRRMVRPFAPDPIDRAVLVRIAMTAQRAERGFQPGPAARRHHRPGRPSTGGGELQ